MPGIRAIGFERFGGPATLALTSVPAPALTSKSVVVRVLAASVNPADALLRSGRQPGVQQTPRPWVPGMEFCGLVLAAAADTTFSPGVRVMGVANPALTGRGAYAGQVAVPAAWLAAAPADLSPFETATLPMNGATALLAVRAAETSHGHFVLITGGGGIVGGYAIQIACQRGLIPIAVGRRGDAELMRQLGAAFVVEAGDNLPDAVKKVTGGVGADALIDTARLGVTAEAAVRTGGVIVRLRGGDERPVDDAKRLSLISVIGQLGDGQVLQDVAEIAPTVLTPRVAHVLPLEDAAEAHRMLARGGIRGRIILDVS